MLHGDIHNLSRYGSLFQKERALRSSNINLFAIQEKSGLSLEAQYAMIEKFISHPLVKNMVLPYLFDPSIVKHQNEVIGGIKFGIRSHCVAAQKNEFLIAKGVVCAFGTGQSVDINRVVAKALVVDKRNIRKSIDRRIQFDVHKDAF